MTIKHPHIKEPEEAACKLPSSIVDDLKGTTPTDISPMVESFCSTFSDATPQYVPVTPEGEAGYCYLNVRKKAEAEGGEIVYGRTIWLAKALIEAEWHAVWLKDGRLVDITAKPDDEKAILFCRTDEKWDGKTVYPNIRKLLTSDPLLLKLIAIQEMMEGDATRLADGRIRYDLGPAVRELFGSSTPRSTKGPHTCCVRTPRVHHARRNDPCPCGSGKKFKKCCIFLGSIS